jgi:hypothetical protein
LISLFSLLSYKFFRTLLSEYVLKRQIKIGRPANSIQKSLLPTDPKEEKTKLILSRQRRALQVYFLKFLNISGFLSRYRRKNYRHESFEKCHVFK